MFSSRNGDGAPVHPLGDPGLRGLQDRRLVAEQQAGDHDRDHAGGVDLLGRDVRHERRDERDARCRAPGRSTRRAHLADDDEDHAARPARRRRPRPGSRSADVASVATPPAPRRDGGAQRDQRGRVVEQRLALQDRDDPPRQADPAPDRGRRDGVRRRDDGADRERSAPRSGPAAAQCTTTPTPSGREHHQPDRSSRIGRRLALKSTSEVCSAAAYSSGGSSPTSTTSGRRCTSGTNGRYDATMPDDDQHQRGRQVVAAGRPR